MIRIRRVQSTQLVLICAFAWCTFALGFLAAVRQEEKKLSIQASPVTPVPLRSGKHETPGVPARLGFKPMTITAHADQGAEVQAEPVDEVEKASTASFRKVLQSPFEDVLSQVSLSFSLLSEGGPIGARSSQFTVAMNTVAVNVLPLNVLAWSSGRAGHRTQILSGKKLVCKCSARKRSERKSSIPRIRSRGFSSGR
jgi:hypothetical protein